MTNSRKIKGSMVVALEIDGKPTIQRSIAIEADSAEETIEILTNLVFQHGTRLVEEIEVELKPDKAPDPVPAKAPPKKSDKAPTPAAAKAPAKKTPPPARTDPAAPASRHTHRQKKPMNTEDNKS